MACRCQAGPPWEEVAGVQSPSAPARPGWGASVGCLEVTEPWDLRPWKGTRVQTPAGAQEKTEARRGTGTCPESHGELQLSARYGPVFTVYLGSRPVVILSGYEAVKEALVDQAEAFSGRGKVATLEKTFNQHGIFFANGDRWKYLRKFTTLSLRNLGMGKKEGEEQIQEEAHCLVEALQNTQGSLLDPSLLLSQAVSNVTCILLFGSRFDYEDEKFRAVVLAAAGTLKEISTSWGQLCEMFSGPLYYLSDILRYLSAPHSRLTDHLSTLATFVSGQIQQHQEKLEPQAPVRDFVDDFLVKMGQEEKASGSGHTDFLLTTVNLLFAGTATVSATLKYAFLLLLKYPEVQDRIQEELSRELGRERAPSLEDRGRLPYTDAFLHEVQRFLALLPMGVPRALTKPTSFRGYDLPQGIEVFPLLGSVLHDPEFFERPEEFDPSRFLDADGRFKKNEAFLPFSLGKRICLGEGLARTELFLFFTTILQNFSLESPSPPGALSLRPAISGFANIPPTFQLRFRPR
ncbi:cytochrome P450 2S1 isoform X1 [Vombatus ursinus]|uniref:Cytochrome P450 family 2 subfamily S member 1 n=1 Tax=Vombatus ursinus TaxID=29139 RepID=A0A4X2K472_VOMUR|nr:cytochrome P450 2S1 isoform X1 [Vombatus ursinus]